ncbi:hypothetical protein RUM43_001639 [Polyplax serrata]|uniref:Uncharacterized protein n=1 Tax=Polyplax serrata TaxID=468196 RepID=A0AAN8SE77_POLSC
MTMRFAERKKLVFQVDGFEVPLDLAANSNVQDAFVIAVEQQARERLERLSALKRIKPVDMTKLSQQLNQIPATDHQKEINGFIEKSPIYVTSINSEYGSNTQLKSYDHIPPEERLKSEELGFHQQGIEDPEVTSELELKQELSDERTVKVFDQPRTSVSVSERHSPFANGRTEVLIGQDGSSLLRTTAVVEHNRLLTEDPDVQLR